MNADRQVSNSASFGYLDNVQCQDHRCCGDSALFIGKKLRPEQNLNPWPVQYWCSALNQLSYAYKRRVVQKCNNYYCDISVTIYM